MVVRPPPDHCRIRTTRAETLYDAIAWLAVGAGVVMLVALPGPHGNSGVGVSKPLRISINPLVVGQFEIAPSHRMDSMARKGATLRPWALGALP
jgi:hypothetical protein